MAISELLMAAKAAQNWEDDASLEHLALVLYTMGREDGTREAHDAYNKKLAAIKARADASRYHKMANAILGDLSPIYSPDYAGDVGVTYCGDAALEK